MAKVKNVITYLDPNLNGTNFNNIASEIVFSFGSFAVTSNFDGRKYIDYTNQLSTFVRPVTLETMGVSEVQSEILHNYSVNAVLNLNKSDLNTFVRFGSAYEFLRTSIQNIIVTYPGSLFMNSQTTRGGNTTFYDFSGDTFTNTWEFKIPINCIVNTFGLVYNNGNLSKPDNIELKNLNISYDKYIIWSTINSTGNSYSVVGFTGNSSGSNFLRIQTAGNPFPMTTGTTGSFDFHIKPNNVIFEEFRSLLNPYEKNIVSERDETTGFIFTLKDPTLLDNGTITYSDSLLKWTTADGYNIDIDTSNYRKFLEAILTIGAKYDTIKTDLIARFLTPTSIKTYDLTEEGKMTKLLKVYGWEFDQLRQFIDSLTNINKVTYDKINNIPDQLIKNLARTFGWNYFSLVNENELVESFLTIDDSEMNLNSDLLPAEIDIELWRRILMNTNYFWKTKGTREAIKSMFLLIGIPEPFINITEYVYTVEGKIDPRSVTLSQLDFPSNSLPYDTDGYPVAPLETNDFYFQVSGDTDSGQAYMDVFRMAGFSLRRTVDNKKSWIQTGSTIRIDDTTPQYYQEDSRLVLNTKEVDVALDTARGIEFDVFDYIKNTDFPANSSGFTLPYAYVNISLGYTGTQNTFQLPPLYNQAEGDLEIRFNGILLNAPKEYSGGTGGTYSETGSTDYIISGNTFTLLTASAHTNTSHRDVIQATYIYSASTNPVSGITIQYMVTRVKPDIIGTTIPLPSVPSGDIQVTVNGIALTKGTPQFVADYVTDPNNPSQIIIQNPDVISYLANNPYIQVAYVTVTGSTSIAARSEISRVDSFNSGKIYFNVGANKYVYKLNYKVNNANEVKILVDGIALEPLTDYSINIQNPYEIFLPKGLKYGSVICAYYLVGGVDFFNPIVSDSFGVGDISQLSFLEFIELIQRRMINARNRKTYTDFKGGWYPTLLNVYVEYIKRSELASDNPLLSNGYTFENLYSFLSKYNAFFQRFVDQLLSATIILRRGGLLIRNSIFTKQKFTYKRGVNFDSTVNYFGDDGSTFLVKQDTTPPIPPPPTLFVNTKVGTAGIGRINTTGGMNIQGFNVLTEYGMQYRTGVTGTWTVKPTLGSLAVDNFTTSLTGLSENKSYQYRAYIKSGTFGYTGNTLSVTTLATPIVPSVTTRITSGIAIDSIINTGGININVFASVQYRAMQYRKWNGFAWESWVTTTLIAGALAVNNYTITITGLLPSSIYQYRAYIVVAGTPYYGNISETATAALPLSAPTVTTGIAYSATTSGIKITGNTITNKGNLPPIGEYGILYTQNATYGTDANLRIANLPTNVKKALPLSLVDIVTGTSYTKSITGLTPNTTIYYRAFAKNASNCFGYGTVKTKQTCPISVTVKLCTITNNGWLANGFVCFSPTLTSGQFVNLDFRIQHHVNSGSFCHSETAIYCKPNGSPSFSQIYCQRTTPEQFCYDSTFNSVQINYGDVICFGNCTTAAAGSCSTLSIFEINTNSPDITAVLGSPISNTVVI